MTRFLACVMNYHVSTQDTPPIGDDVTDDSGSDNTNDTPTIALVPQDPSITLDKIADGDAFLDGSVPGERIIYSFVITNTGNVTLTDVVVTDFLAGIEFMGDPIITLAPTDVDTITFSAEYPITKDDIDRGTVINNATVTGNYFDNVAGVPAMVTDTDSEETIVANIEAIAEVFPPFATDGGVTTSVLASDLFQNDPVDLSIVTIEVLASDPEITLDLMTGLITVPPGTPAGTYTVTYEICSIDLPSICASTTETVVQLARPSIETTKTQELIDNGDSVDGVGDTVRYTITVENIGNVPVTDIVLTDTFTAIGGTPDFDLTSGPDFTGADDGSGVENLEIGETATYIATFILDVDAVTACRVENTVVADALLVFADDVLGTPAPLTDRSDNGVDDDGNTVDDPAILVLVPSLQNNPDLTLTKVTPVNIAVRGQAVPYTITDSPFAAGPLDIVDTLT